MSLGAALELVEHIVIGTWAGVAMGKWFLWRARARRLKGERDRARAMFVALATGDRDAYERARAQELAVGGLFPVGKAN